MGQGAGGAGCHRTHQWRPWADLLSWCSAVPAASGVRYPDALRAFTSLLVVSQSLIMVALKEPPEFLLGQRPWSLESAVQNISGSKWIQHVLISSSVKLSSPGIRTPTMLVAQSDN